MVTLVSFVIVLGILIFVHEFGHFIVAKACGVGVEKFSIGFGPKIFGWKQGMTDYMVSAIPLGGYVKMVGEEPDFEIDEKEIPYSFTHKKLWQRFLVVGAGPFFNLLLAVVLYFFLYWIKGTYYYPAIAGEITPSSPAYKAGLMIGDEIKTVDKKKIESWSDFQEKILKSEGRVLELSVLRSQDEKIIYLKPEKMDTITIFGEKKKQYQSGTEPYLPPLIGAVSKDSPAFAAGLKKNDIILNIDSQKVDTWNDVSRIISKSDKEIQIVIKRDGEKITRKIMPKITEYKNKLGEKESRKIIGIAALNILQHGKIGVFGAVEKSFSQTWTVIELTGAGIVKMVNGSISRNNLGGPIMIAQMAGDQARQGLISFFAFIAFISINLGLLNLLPVPVLDGGHLMFFLIEGITGKPVSIKGRGIAQQIGLFLLLLLMGFAFYNDIVRLISG